MYNYFKNKSSLFFGHIGQFFKFSPLALFTVTVTFCPFTLFNGILYM